MDLQAIKARRAAITPGKWRTLPLTNHDYNVSWGVGGENATIFFAQGRCKQQNAAFIAAAPADIDALVKRVEELEADTIRTAAIEAFRVLAQDNTYALGPNNAWKILGEALGMVTSTDLQSRTFVCVYCGQNRCICKTR